MILMIDNYDSFTYNIVQYLGELGADVQVFRNDAISVADIDVLAPEKIVISPGPCTPSEAGISLDVIKAFAGRIPLLGVCLGHQAIGQAFGGDVVHARQVMHGKLSPMYHKSTGVFSDLSNPFTATRYHSLVIDKHTLPECLEVTAWTQLDNGEQDEIMGVRHKTLDIQGVQFHPESILSEHGHHLPKLFAGQITMDIKLAIRRLCERQDLNVDDMAMLMREIMTGQCSDAQIAAFLVALQMKGIKTPELLGAAKTMRSLAAPVKLSPDAHLVDTCGTGGTSTDTFNISTSAAMVAACAGARVAKHGNRGATSKSGSADVLEAAGVRLNITPAQVAQCVEQLGVGFMFAPGHHSAMKHVIGPRKEIGVRTIFNMLGPLTNPAGAPNQVLGVFDAVWIDPVLDVLGAMGSHHVLVLSSDDGLDEISISAPTQIGELREGHLVRYTVVPADFGMQQQDNFDMLKVSSPQESLALVRQALNYSHQAAGDIVALNAGAAIYAANLCDDLPAGVKLAQEILRSGQALEKLEHLAAFTQALPA